MMEKMNLSLFTVPCAGVMTFGKKISGTTRIESGMITYFKLFLARKIAH